MNKKELECCIKKCVIAKQKVQSGLFPHFLTFSPKGRVGAGVDVHCQVHVITLEYQNMI